MNYIIGCGNHETPIYLQDIWMANTLKYARADRIVIISDSRSEITDCQPVRFVDVGLSGNLGSFMNLINNEKPHHFNGWTGAVLALAMISYCNESDFIYKESDCLAFGDWVQHLYDALGDGGVVFGNCSFMKCEQSLFLVRHSYIPEFCRLILSEPPQRTHDNIGETMWARIEERNPKMWRRFTMGVGRDRPIDFDNPLFYAQKLSDDELALLRVKGLI